MANKQALARGHVVRDELREHGEFTQQQFVDALKTRLSDFADEAFDDLVQNVARTIDERATREKGDEDERQLLLPGIEAEMGGDYRLGQGRRVAKSRAYINHVVEAIHLAQENLAATQQSLSRRLAEFHALLPFWPAGVTKAEAVAAFRQANPSAGVS